MAYCQHFYTPNKQSSYPEPTLPIFEDFHSFNSTNLSLIEPIGQPHNHPSTLRGEKRKRNGTKKLNINSSKFSQQFSGSPFAGSESINGMFDSTDVTHSSITTESVVQNNTAYTIEHLDLVNFKAKLCPIAGQHNHKHCPFYHNSKDRKRPGNAFSSEMCENAENPESCPFGDKCPKAHNRVEQLYKPEKYKTKFCSHYPNNLHLCEYGSFCSFAHSETDINIELIHNYEYDDDFYMFHFKTAWCPFNLTQHDKALCVYAHNWQDYRRKPQLANYDPIPCPNWKSTDFILNYEDGCPNKERCTKCHGWKELEYHPLLYKTRACGKTCSKGRDCPNYHAVSERRVINQNIIKRIFRVVPRNRIVEGTFKTRILSQSSSNKASCNQSVNKSQNHFLDDQQSVEITKYGSMVDLLFSSENKPQSSNDIPKFELNVRNWIDDSQTEKEQNPKRCNSFDLPSFDEIRHLRKSTEDRVNSFFYLDEPEFVESKRKWSVPDQDHGSSRLIQQGCHCYPNSTQRLPSQIHARELEDDTDSLEIPAEMDNRNDNDSSDGSIDLALRQNLERIIDSDDI